MFALLTQEPEIVARYEKRFQQVSQGPRPICEKKLEEHLGDEGNINKKGMDYLERHHPHIKIDKKSRLILVDYITVDSVVSHVQTRIGKNQR